MKPIRVAQIGTMHDHASPTFHSMLRQPEFFDVVGSAEICPDRESRLYKERPHYTVEQLLNMDLDAVAIETEENRATEFAQMFADRGVHIHMDKPGSHGTASFNRLADTLQARGKVFHLGYMYRYNPVVMDVMHRALDGEWGDIYAVEAHMSVHHGIQKHRWLCRYPGGMMYFLGCHLVDLVVRLQGEPEEVIALNSRTGQDVPECEDYGFAVLKYKNGVSFVKSCSAEYNGFDRRQLVICGTKGTVEINPLEIHVPGDGHLQKTSYRITGDKEEVAIFGNDNAKFRDSVHYDRYNLMMRSFAQYVRGEKENPYSYEYEKKVFAIFMKCCGVKEE